MFLFFACAESDEYPFEKFADRDAETDTAGDTDTVRDLVNVHFTGAVVTIAGTPLGLSDADRLTAVSGAFTYNRAVSDDNDDPSRGDYFHHGSSALSLTVGTHTITGTGWAEAQVEDLDPDTFRFVDGASELEPPAFAMTLDGTADDTLGVWFAITASTGAAQRDDELPATFPYTADLPHTFSIDDSGGTALLQLDTLE